MLPPLPALQPLPCLASMPACLPPALNLPPPPPPCLQERLAHAQQAQELRLRNEGLQGEVAGLSARLVAATEDAASGEAKARRMQEELQEAQVGRVARVWRSRLCSV